jgi:FkbM family methyltransferase
MRFSQNDEQDIIKNYFGDFVGTFLDCGANDGITLSNTRALAEAGWKGVLIEPSPKAYARLVENYKNFSGIYTYPFALSHANREMTLHESSSLLNQNDIGLVSTFHDHEKERFKSVCQYTEVKVKAFRWKTFLNRLSIKRFDFISMDIEGSELDVLPQIDLTKVKMICVEWNGKNKQQFTDICAGFRLIAENGENLIFAR